MVNLYDAIKVHPKIYRLITSKGLVFAYYVCPQKASVEHIYTSESYFLYALEGKKVFHSAGKSFLLLPGTSAFVRKGAYFMERFDDDFKIIEIFFPENYLNQIIQEIRPQSLNNSNEHQPLELVTEIETNSIMQACYDSLLPYFSKQPPPAESILELKFKEFILNVLLNPKNNKILGYFNRTLPHYRIPLQQVMEENYTHNLSLGEYAKISCRSLASFKREFIDLYHITPGKWLIQKKLEHAKMLLDSTEKTISEIVFESGFENNSHFSRVFKDRFRLSPNFYRKKISQQVLIKH